MGRHTDRAGSVACLNGLGFIPEKDAVVNLHALARAAGKPPVNFAGPMATEPDPAKTHKYQ
ncbi:hypothetical protein GCM10028819_31280 [Spirosoma humi]